MCVVRVYVCVCVILHTQTRAQTPRETSFINKEQPTRSRLSVNNDALKSEFRCYDTQTDAHETGDAT